MSERELKPCPFCGGEAAFDRISAPQSELLGMRIYCTACGAGLRTKQGYDPTDAAVQAWNTRVHDSEEPTGDDDA